MRFAELLARSCFSFLQGASHPDELAERSAELDHAAIALCDRDGLYGSVRLHAAAQRIEHRSIVGAELTLDRPDAYSEHPYPSVALLVEDAAGYASLCRLLTRAHADHEKGEAGIHTAEIAEEQRGLFAVVPLDPRCPVAGEDLARLREAFGDRCALATWRHLEPADKSRVHAAIEASRRHDMPIVASNRPRYHDRSRKPLSDVVTCIRLGITLAEAGTRLSPNAEAELKGAAAMNKLFPRHPEWVERSALIADRCLFSLSELRYCFPSDYGDPGRSPDDNLRHAVDIGARDRYPDGVPVEVRAQLDRELALIADLEVASYFLSVQQIVTIARERSILCQGRGSAANSAVCYVLGITAIDPVRSSLLFERFMSTARREPPDIDVDFEHERREEVIQEIYRRYGRDRSAMVSEVICYRGKSALREVGKVFGLAPDQLDRLSSMASSYIRPDPHEGNVEQLRVTKEALKRRGLDPSDRGLVQAVRLASELEGFPRHLSIHVGGFILSSEPLHHVAPIEPARMEDRTVVPWDKDDLEELGFFKVDVLGLGMLTAIRKALGFIHVGEHPFDPIAALDSIPPEDAAVYDACCKADTVGVFQIESRAQMAMLPILRPRAFYDLVVEVGIVRPGPIQGKMVHPYLRRRTGEEEVSYPHPCLEPILSRTLGVPLFQEQVMQLAITGAGYDPGEADQLRRDMAAWRKDGRLARHQQKLVEGFRKNGVPDEFGERLYKQILGFGEYGFPECVVGETLVLDAASGRRVPIEDVVHGRVPLRTTIACDEHLRLRKRKVLAATPSGPREVFRLRTALGRELIATAEHPLLTRTGWQPLASLLTEEVAICPDLAKERQEREGWGPHPPTHCQFLARMTGMTVDWDRVVSIEPVGVRETYDLTIDGDHNFLANDFIVHNSHAASFALLVYASAWLKVHYPAAFAGALINSQPMGFYSPASIVRDAQKHGVEVRPVRVDVSDWDCTLEGKPQALRLGLRLVKGLGEESAKRIVAERVESAFSSVDDFVLRTHLRRDEVELLAEAGALESLLACRREALWRARAPREEGLYAGKTIEPDERIGLAPLTAREQLSLDFGTVGISLHDHPMKHMRKKLSRRRVLRAADQAGWQQGRSVVVAGVVLTRQRPSTASGVVFVTLEDETGTLNLVLYSTVFERYELTARHAGMMLARGRVDRRGEVVHIRVHHLERLDMPGDPLSLRSRDFH